LMKQRNYDCKSWYDDNTSFLEHSHKNKKGHI
jgi:hypothetical protein